MKIRYVITVIIAGAVFYGCRATTPGPELLRESARPGFDVRVNAHTASTQSGTVLADDARGGYFAAWQSRRQNSGLDALCVRHIDRHGVLSGPEVWLHDDRAVGRWQPTLVRSGQILWAAWIADEAGGPRVIARRFDFQLQPLGDEFAVAGASPSGQDEVALVGYGDGAVLLAWTAPTAAGPRRIMTQRLDHAGHALGMPGTISTGAGGDDRVPALAVDGRGAALCLWGRVDAGGVPGTILVRELTADGAPRGRQRVVVSDPQYGHIEPAVAMTAEGRWQAAWLSATPLGYRISTTSGKLGRDDDLTVQRLDQAAFGSATGVAVALRADGRGTVAWGAYDDAHQAVRAVGVRLAPDGSQASRPCYLSTLSTRDQRLASGPGGSALLYNTDDTLAVAWFGDGGLGDASGAHLSVHDVEALAAATPMDTAGANPHVPPTFNPKFRPRPRKRPPVESAETGDGDFGFDGMTFTGWNPPDPHMAAGPDHLVLVTNGEVSFYTKGGTRTFFDELHGPSGFFGVVGATTFVFDPEVLWDDDSQRFFITAVERDQLPPSSGEPFIVLAVSDDADPNGLWHKYRFDVRELAGPGNIDSPNMSIDSDVVYIGADMLPAGGNPQAHFIFIVEKAPLLDGDPPVERGLTVPGHKAAGMVITTGMPPAQYLIEADLGFGTHATLDVHAVTDPLGNPQFQSTAVTVPAYERPEDPSSLGTSLRVETFDARFWSCMYRNGSIWATHHINATNVRQRWYEIALNGWPDGGQPTLVQSGDVLPGDGLRTFFGSIWADVEDNAAMVFSASSSLEYISIRRTHRLATDPPGEMQPVLTVRESTQPFIQGAPSSRRWGDYSMIVGDPVLTGGFWFHHEYKTTSTWKTWVSQAFIESPVPAVIDTYPPSGAIDARQPLAVKNGEPVGWDQVDLIYDIAVGERFPEDYLVESSGGVAPVVIETTVNGNIVNVLFDAPIPPGECTRLTSLPDDAVVDLGYLPADADGDGTAAALDILELIDNLNGIVDPPLPLWRCDIDRSNECNPLDILRVVDLLNGADDFQPWLGQMLPACP